MKKICSKCKKEKEIEKFWKSKVSKDKLDVWCKECRTNFQKDNKKVKSYNKKSYKNNLRKRKNYYLNNKEKIKSYYKNNQDYKKEYQKQYKIENPEYQNQYVKLRKSYDPLFKIKLYLRSKIGTFLKGKKNKKTEKLLGYSFQDFLNHIEDEKLLFEVYGIKYNIDHKIPISWFKEDTPINIIWNLENIWLTTENYNKSKKNNFADEIGKNYMNLIKPYLKNEYENYFNNIINIIKN